MITNKTSLGFVVVAVTALFAVGCSGGNGGELTQEKLPTADERIQALEKNRPNMPPEQKQRLIDEIRRSAAAPPKSTP